MDGFKIQEPKSKPKPKPKPIEKAEERAGERKSGPPKRKGTFFPQEPFGYAGQPAGGIPQAGTVRPERYLDDAPSVKRTEPEGGVSGDSRDAAEMKEMPEMAEKPELTETEEITEPKLPAPASETESDGITTYGEPLGNIGEYLEETTSVRLADYKVPADLEMPKKKVDAVQKKERARKAGAFNAMLEKIEQNNVWSGPFIVHIVVGDLKGFGDITAGAKLAAELSAFYKKYKVWQGVSVKLILMKLDMLRGVKGKEAEAEKIRDITGSILTGSGAELLEEYRGDADLPVVSLGYPAHNVAKVDMIIQQYGYEQYGDGAKYPTYGSGPGYGSLGTILPSQVQIAKAVAIAEGTAEGVEGPYMQVFRDFCGHAGIRKIHFSYYSIYEEHYKEFVRMMSKREGGVLPGTAFVFAGKAYDELIPLADSLAAGMNLKSGSGVRIIGVTLTSKGIGMPEILYPRKGKKPVPKGKKGRKRGPATAEADRQEAEGTEAEGQAAEVLEAAGPAVYLVCMDGRLSQPEMMAMYYASTGEVGATGDQSFIEAYTMRREKIRGGHPDETRAVLYGVPEQQTKLYGQLLEIKDQQHRFAVETQGVKRIEGDPSLDVMLDSKPLLIPVVMLINDVLLKKYPKADQVMEPMQQ